MAVTLSFKVKSFLKVAKKRVKLVPMSKNETIFVRLSILLIWAFPLQADITVGLLISIDNNAKQTLLYKNATVICEPFGIVTLEKMMTGGTNPKECQAAIETFYKAHPHERNFAREHLYVQQSYHYEKINEGCVLYANGVESYSEMLLRNGLALIDPKFNQIEWNGRLKRALFGAEKQKIGLHMTQIQKNCMKEEK